MKHNQRVQQAAQFVSQYLCDINRQNKSGFVTPVYCISICNIVTLLVHLCNISNPTSASPQTKYSTS
jgi:hypothetical protein